MGNLNINNAISSDFTNSEESYVYEVSPIDTKGVSDQKETIHQSTTWAKNWAYFNTIPDLKAALVMRSIWNVGKGFTADQKTLDILDRIKGAGKDSFEDVLYNLDLVAAIDGDSYALITRDDSGEILNIRPLDPSSIQVVYDRNGMIKEYRQVSKLGGKKPEVFKPHEIFHLPNLRLADSISGISEIAALEALIKADQESFNNTQKVMRRQAKPLIVFKLKTDNETEIQAFANKMDLATNKGENIYVPYSDNEFSYEVVQVDTGSLILSWRDSLRNSFFRAIGLPQIVPGAGGQSTESESKVIYLAFEQIVERRQKFIEKQIWNQLQLKIDLVPPATLSQQLQADNAKDGSGAPQPSDTTAGSGR